MNDRVSGAQLDQVPSAYWKRTDLRRTVTLCNWPFSSSTCAVFSISTLLSFFMSTPFSGVGCVAAPLSTCGGTHPLRAACATSPAHHIQPAALGLNDAGLLHTHDARFERGRAALGAVGWWAVFYLFGGLHHGADRRFFWPFEPHNSSQQG